MCAPRCANQVIAPAVTSIPVATSGLGPILGIAAMVDRLAEMTRPPTIGKNAALTTRADNQEAARRRCATV
ncbi:MAG: hypothetical protein ACRDPY_31365 [Streptosporangiaceae bacterium]